MADSRCLGEGPVTFVEVSHFLWLVAGVQFGGKEMAPRPPNEAGKGHARPFDVAQFV